MKKQTLLFIAVLTGIFALGVVVSQPLYEWWSNEIVVTEDLSGTVTWSGTPIVGETIMITVTITNPTGADVPGSLLVEIYESDKATLDEQLFTGDITVLTTGWSDSYSWTANLGSHYAKATFTAS